jgi:S-adenosylmethionine-diacylglycerol 3-amino-3-carboxypropyl transferase
MSHQYFEDFNYSLANEDTWIELGLAKSNLESIFAVCGSGSRSVPLISLNPRELHVTDLSLNQLRLFQLRLAAIKNLEYEEYLFFLGYLKTLEKANPQSERILLFDHLQLTKEEKDYWKERQEVWSPNGFIYLGRWEKHFMMLGRVFQQLTFSDLKPIFSSRNLAEQKDLVKKHWPKILFKLYTKLVLNSYVSNKLLYKGAYAGSNERRTSEQTPSELIFNEFNYLFENTWVRSNYFLQLIFLNEIHFREALPAEANREVFNKVKQSKTQVFYHQKNLLDLAKEKPHNFYSLSDTFSYLTNDQAQGFFKNLPNVESNTQIVIRSFMREPTFKVDSNWAVLEDEMKKAKMNDCTRMYDFKILKLP